MKRRRKTLSESSVTEFITSFFHRKDPPHCPEFSGMVRPPPVSDPPAVSPMGNKPAPRVADDVRHGAQTPATEPGPCNPEKPRRESFEFHPDGSVTEIWNDGFRATSGGPDRVDPARAHRERMEAELNFPDPNDPANRKKKKRGGPGSAGGTGIF